MGHWVSFSVGSAAWASHIGGEPGSATSREPQDHSWSRLLSGHLLVTQSGLAEPPEPQTGGNPLTTRDQQSLAPAFPIIRLDNARKGFFEEAEFRTLLTQLPEYLHAPMMFAYLTGWRLASEVLALTWNQVDLSAGTVRLEPGSTKNREGREFPVVALPELQALLSEQRERTRKLERETGAIIQHVFHRRGDAIRSFRTAWRNACLRSGLVGMLAHDFRRTAVRNLERAGVPRSVAMSSLAIRQRRSTVGMLSFPSVISPRVSRSLRPSGPLRSAGAQFLLSLRVLTHSSSTIGGLSPDSGKRISC